MYSQDIEVIRSVSQWLNQGDSVWYVTITKTWGASPRPIGSLFAFNPACKKQVGSLSGGCVEQDLINELSSLPTSVPPFSSPILKQYGLSQEEVVRFQLPCGGQLDLVLELLSPHQNNLNLFDEMFSLLCDRKRIQRQLSLLTGKSTLVTLNCDSHSEVQINSEYLSHIIGPEYRLLIVGVGDVSHYLIEMALAVDFNVSLCDPRIEFIDRYRLKTNRKESMNTIKAIHCLPDDLVRENFHDEYCCIVALSHDPRVDDMALMEALKSNAFFVGAMGSLKTSENRVSRLKKLGMTPQQLAKLHAPVGVPINSKMPAEIAISIISQLILYRNLHANKVH